MISHWFEPEDWNKGIEANNLEDLKKFINQTSPFCKDAREAVSKMNDQDFKKYKSGLAKERKGIYAGNAWCEKYGAILLPFDFIKAHEITETYQVPLGTALIRMREEKII